MITKLNKALDLLQKLYWEKIAKQRFYTKDGTPKRCRYCGSKEYIEITPVPYDPKHILYNCKNPACKSSIASSYNGVFVKDYMEWDY